jgi:hypothetical protein
MLKCLFFIIYSNKNNIKPVRALLKVNLNVNCRRNIFFLNHFNTLEIMLGYVRWQLIYKCFSYGANICFSQNVKRSGSGFEIIHNWIGKKF